MWLRVNAAHTSEICPGLERLRSDKKGLDIELNMLKVIQRIFLLAMSTACCMISFPCTTLGCQQTPSLHRFANKTLIFHSFDTVPALP